MTANVLTADMLRQMALARMGLPGQQLPNGQPGVIMDPTGNGIAGVIPNPNAYQGPGSQLGGGGTQAPQPNSMPNPSNPLAYNGPGSQLGPGQSSTMELLREAKAPTPMIRRNAGGGIMDQNAPSGLDWLKQVNGDSPSFEQEQAATRDRQRSAGQSAVAEMKEMQKSFTMPDPNRVEASPDGTRMAYRNGMPVGSNTAMPGVATNGGQPIGGFTDSERGFFAQEAGRVNGQQWPQAPTPSPIPNPGPPSFNGMGDAKFADAMPTPPSGMGMGDVRMQESNMVPQGMAPSSPQPMSSPTGMSPMSGLPQIGGAMMNGLEWLGRMTNPGFANNPQPPMQPMGMGDLKMAENQPLQPPPPSLGIPQLPMTGVLPSWLTNMFTR